MAPVVLGWRRNSRKNFPVYFSEATTSLPCLRSVWAIIHHDASRRDALPSHPHTRGIGLPRSKHVASKYDDCPRKDVSHCIARYNELGAREKRFASRIGGYVIIAEKKYFAVDAIRHPAKQPTFFVNSFGMRSYQILGRNSRRMCTCKFIGFKAL